MGNGSMEMLPETQKMTQKNRMRFVFPSAREILHAMIRQLPAFGMFFLLSMAKCLSVPSPYAVCCMAVTAFSGIGTAGAWAGLAAGILFQYAWGAPLDIWQFIACAVCAGIVRHIRKKRAFVRIIVGVVLLLKAVPGCVNAAEVREILLNGFGVLLGIAIMPALFKAAEVWKKGIREMDQDGVLCVMLPVMLLIVGAGRIEGFGVNFGYVVSGVTTLLIAWCTGSAAGVLWGLGCGMALVLGGQNAIFLINLVLGGVLCGMVREKARIAAAGLYLISALTMTYLIMLRFYPALFFADLAGCAVFCLLPGKWTRQAALFFRRIQWSKPRENAYMRLRIQRWVKSIEEMADAQPMPSIPDTQTADRAEGMMNALCAGCEREDECWGERFQETKEGMQALAERSAEDGDELDVINRYFSRCIRISHLPAVLRNVEEEKLRKAQRVLCAQYERDMLLTHLSALSQAAQRVILESGESDEEAEWIRQTEEAMHACRFPGRAVFAKAVDGRKTVCLQTGLPGLRLDPEGALIREIGLRLRGRMAVTENSGGRIVLEEEPPLALNTGIATACAVTGEGRRNGKKTDNGDAVLLQGVGGGRHMIALSDGMGHGTGAQDESRKTLQLLSLCLRAGYTRAQAVTAVNGSMLSATCGEKFATVDLCLVDLWTGETAMNKLGACQSYLCRGQRIEEIQGEALPLGIIERVIPMEHLFTMAEGDLLVLMTDGIADAFEEEDEILFVLRDCREGTPQKIADDLLREAMIRYGGMPPDDMTVVCARMTERKRTAA